MDNKLTAAIAIAPKKVLIETVKLAQKQGRKGSTGDWKDFLNIYDKKFGACLSDPAKRNHQTLASFLLTFTDDDNAKFVGNTIKKLSNREVLEVTARECSDNELPEQRLVRLTFEHPLYVSKYTFPSSSEDGWVVTKVGKKSKLKCSNRMLAIDCEMVLCEDGTDAVVRVCIVDRKLQVRLDEKVNPFKPVADYRTEITGIAARDLEGVTKSLHDVQVSLEKLLSKGAILVGHSLNNDLKALKMDHSRVVDTSFLYKSWDGRAISLNNLCKSVLGYELRKQGAPHNCLDDACAAMRLALAMIEKGVDYEFLVIRPDVKEIPEDEMAKLLLHNVPITVSIEELHGLFSENFKIEIKPQKKALGLQYSALACFENPEEANQAFAKLDGSLDKDSLGRPQKLVTLRLKNGEDATLYARKMIHEDYVHQVSGKKRESACEDSGDVKRLKTDQCDEPLKKIERLIQELRDKQTDQCTFHLTEIEKLKQELSAKDFQIASQDKIIMDLKKKLVEMKNMKKKR